MSNWQFHFRNFDAAENWFGVYHAGCGGAPWHEGRPNCWGQYIPTNPTGGDNSNYQPSSWVVDFGAWLDVIIEGLETIVNLAVFIGSDGDNMKALEKAFADAFKVEANIVKAEIEARKLNTEDLQKALQENLQSACAAIGQTPATVAQMAQDMGLGTSGWGLITGADYQSRIHNDNSTLNGGYGWTILRSPPSGTADVDYITNHAFIQNGHLIYAWNSRNLSGFWSPYSEWRSGRGLSPGHASSSPAKRQLRDGVERLRTAFTSPAFYFVIQTRQFSTPPVQTGCCRSILPPRAFSRRRD